ncbi:antitoxin of toxin-antitoxin stability system [Henriciella aquimarina]|uniref:antitoxin of toxin-antitoxin stability system n=1 Tax=Henriciella aquimarina TaxID=545261 RepID=UPI000A01C66A|nr:antitoxin of toxin-antitoxin stability system [Henriciella aquimarina]
MPEIIETTVYQLSELSPSVREKARDWYREGGFDYDGYSATFDDFERICDMLDIRLKTHAVRLYSGRTRDVSSIWFTGFWCQGDGACFEGSYAYAAGAARAIRTYAPKAEKLHAIADMLQAVQRRNFYQLCADIRHSGRYYHEYTMLVTVERDSPSGQAMTSNAETTIVEALRDLARWLYRQLETEHEYLNSDEVVDETIAANGYTFTEAGRRFG